MKAVLYGSYPACELARLKKFLRTPWQLVAIMDEAPAKRKAAELADADVLVTSKYQTSDPRAPKLRLLQCSSTGTEGLHLQHLPSGCTVCNVFGHELGIAEYVMWAILDWSVDYRNIPSFLSTGTWTVDEWISMPNHCEAFEKTIGIVGFGHIGREVARRGKALGMKAIALSTWQNSRPDYELLDQTFTMSDAKAFLARADFIVVCCPLTAETGGMIDARWIAAMRRNAVLIHVGRGPVVDEESLYMALKARTIRGATIDVWYEYPKSARERVCYSHYPFHELSNVVVTPHVSGRSEESWDRRFQQIARNLDALACRTPLDNIIEHRVPLKIGGKNIAAHVAERCWY